MPDVSLSGWLSFAVLVSSAIAAGTGIARHLPFVTNAAEPFVATAFGAAAAPFLLGLAGVAVLGLLPGAEHSAHYATALTGMVAIALVGHMRAGPRHARAARGATPSGWDGVLAMMLALWVLLLLANALLIPLSQSDSLEYATAARRLFGVRDLSAYPPLDPVNDPSGFYGPWTHPPLYPVLLYLSYVCQGHAAAPGLIRLVSPWALLAAAALTGALGGMISRTAGLVSALLLLSTPLLFFGSDSAQIDSLSCAGFALVLAGVVSFDLSCLRGRLWLGAVVGVALWAHSQAVLLLPMTGFALLIMYGVRGWRGFLSSAAVVTAVAIAVGGWPYLENYRRTGALISDNPDVFALAQLDWPGYFRAARGFDSPAARLQYGVLKAWFALEAYALTFWLMAAGLVLIGPRIRTALSVLGTSGRGPLPPEIGAFAMCACYFAGMAVSALVGIDLMIKSERYLLMITPCAALLAGAGVARVLGPRAPASSASRASASGLLPALAGSALLALFALQLGAMAPYRVRTLDLSFAQITSPLEMKRLRLAPYSAIEYLRRRTPRDALVLSLKPSDMYYSDRKMMSYLDPRLIPVYREPDAALAAHLLLDLGVTYVHLPDYALPPLYNSALGAMLATPRLARLEHSVAGHQVYAIGDASEQAAAACASVSVGPRVSKWSWERGYVFGERKRLFELSQQPHALRPDGAVSEKNPVPWAFRRDYSTRLASPRFGIRLFEAKRGEGCGASREVLALTELSGHGFAHVSVEHFGADGESLGEEALGGTALPGDRDGRSYARRFWLRESAASLRLVVEYRGSADVRVRGARIAIVTGAESPQRHLNAN